MMTSSDVLRVSSPDRGTNEACDLGPAITLCEMETGSCASCGSGLRRGLYAANPMQSTDLQQIRI